MTFQNSTTLEPVWYLGYPVMGLGFTQSTAELDNKLLQIQHTIKEHQLNPYTNSTNWAVLQSLSMI